MMAYKNQLPGYPGRGWKAKDGEEEEESDKFSVNNGQVHTWTKIKDVQIFEAQRNI